MNRHPEPQPARAELVPYDLVRRALEVRIEMAKDRLFADLDEAQRQLRSFTASAARGLAKRVMRAVLIGGVVALGIVAALVRRRRQRRLRIVWK